MKLQFNLNKKNGNARRGQLTFERGTVQTPAFMPVGTYGTVKGMTPEEVKATGAEILLGNTFHLWLRPGQEVMKMHGGTPQAPSGAVDAFLRWTVQTVMERVYY